SGDRRVQGPGRPDEKVYPGRAERAKQADALRAVLAPRDEAPARVVTSDDLAAPRHARANKARQDRAPETVQVPRARPGTARTDRQSLDSDHQKGRMHINVT